MTTAAAASLNKLRILVVDDYFDSAQLFAMMLGMDGHEARPVGSAEAALAAAGDFHPQVAFIDLKLPDMHGFDLAPLLRALPGLQQMVLVAMTGLSEDEHKLLAQQAGFNHYLVKPADAAAIKKILNQGFLK